MLSRHRDGKLPDFIQLPNTNGNQPLQPIVTCSQHMCPIRVHWHLKTSYKEYWRVKITITNLNLVQNYSDWNLVIQHPNLKSLTQVFSFNYQPLIQYGNISEYSSLFQLLVVVSSIFIILKTIIPHSWHIWPHMCILLLN